MDDLISILQKKLENSTHILVFQGENEEEWKRLIYPISANNSVKGFQEVILRKLIPHLKNELEISIAGRDGNKIDEILHRTILAVNAYHALNSLPKREENNTTPGLYIWALKEENIPKELLEKIGRFLKDSTSIIGLEISAIYYGPIVDHYNVRVFIPFYRKSLIKEVSLSKLSLISGYYIAAKTRDEIKLYRVFTGEITREVLVISKNEIKEFYIDDDTMDKIAQKAVILRKEEFFNKLRKIIIY